MTTPALQETFQNRVEQHKKILYKVCNVYCRDRDSREDLAQEITFQLWRSYWKFDGRCQFSTWMYRIALNVAISFYRSEGARTRLVISDEQHLLDAVDNEERQAEEGGPQIPMVPGAWPVHCSPRTQFKIDVAA